MEKQNNSVGKTALIVLLLLVTIVSLVLATFAWARYTDTTDGNATAQVAKWNVNGTLGDSMFSKQFNFVLDNRLAPGTSGTISANLDVTGTEVDVIYSITLLNVEATSGTIPRNFKIYAADGSTVIYENRAIKNSGTIKADTIVYSGEAATKKVDAKFKWEWPYQSGTAVEGSAIGEYSEDANDTVDGQNAGTIKLTYRIDAYQKQPTAK